MLIPSRECYGEALNRIVNGSLYVFTNRLEPNPVTLYNGWDPYPANAAGLRADVMLCTNS